MENEDNIKCWCSTSGHICVVVPKETTEKVVFELAGQKMGKSNIKCLGLEPCSGQTPREVIKDYELERAPRRSFNLSIVQEKDKGRRTIYL